MVEGRGSKAFIHIKKMMYTEPKSLHLMLDKLTKSIILYLNAQIRAGAQSVMIFDIWCGVLTELITINFLYIKCIRLLMVYYETMRIVKFR